MDAKYQISSIMLHMNFFYYYYRQDEELWGYAEEWHWTWMVCLWDFPYIYMATSTHAWHPCFWQNWRNTTMVTQGGGTIRPHASRFLLTSHPPFVVGHRPTRCGSIGRWWRALVYSYRYILTLRSQFERICRWSHILGLGHMVIPRFIYKTPIVLL